jgi:hypothetical protein
MKLNKYQNDTQIPLALFLQVLVLHFVYFFLFIRIFKVFVIAQELSQNLRNTFQVAIAKGYTRTHVLFAL